jgi:uncharacterized protein (DUF2384 family)
MAHKSLKKDDTVLNPLVVDRLERITQQAINLFEDESEAQKWLIRAC